MNTRVTNIVEYQLKDGDGVGFLMQLKNGEKVLITGTTINGKFRPYKTDLVENMDSVPNGWFQTHQKKSSRLNIFKKNLNLLKNYFIKRMNTLKMKYLTGDATKKTIRFQSHIGLKVDVMSAVTPKKKPVLIGDNRTYLYTPKYIRGNKGFFRLPWDANDRSIAQRLPYRKYFDKKHNEKLLKEGKITKIGNFFYDPYSRKGASAKRKGKFSWKVIRHGSKKEKILKSIIDSKRSSRNSQNDNSFMLEKKSLKQSVVPEMAKPSEKIE